MKIHVICVPYQLDVGRWAYALGPKAFLDGGLIDICHSLGHSVVSTTWIDLPRHERTRDVVTNLGRIASRTSLTVATIVKNSDGLALVLEGDCSHAVGVIGGLSRVYPSGMVWFDAHGDLHTYATTSTGYVGGMPVAVALGWDLSDWQIAAGLANPIRPEATALIGASDLDPEEIKALQDHPITRLDAESLRSDAAARVTSALNRISAEAEAWYLHVDVDVAGPNEVPGGLTPSLRPPDRDALLAAVYAAAAALRIRALSLATYNPSGDPESRGRAFGLEMLKSMLSGISDSLPKHER